MPSTPSTQPPWSPQPAHHPYPPPPGSATSPYGASPPHGAPPQQPDGPPSAPADAPKIELKPIQLAGGALASVTSALAASAFGVTGTVIGAAFGSVVSSVAAAVYATSLTRAGHRIRTVVVTPIGARGSAGVADPADPTAVPGELTGAASFVVGDSMVAPNGVAWPPEPAARPEPAHPYAGGYVPEGAPHARQSTEPRPSPSSSGRRSRRFVKPALVMGGFAFAASTGAILATELALGHPLGDSGVHGTSFSGFVGGGNAPRTPDATPTPSTTGPSSSASTSAEASPSSTSTSDGAGGNPSGDPTTSPTPTEVSTSADGQDGGTDGGATQAPDGSASPALPTAGG